MVESGLCFKRSPWLQGTGGMGGKGEAGWAERGSFCLCLVPLPSSGDRGPPSISLCLYLRLVCQRQAHWPSGLSPQPTRLPDLSRPAWAVGEGHSSPVPGAGGAQEQSGPSDTHAPGGSSEAPGAPSAPLLPTHLLAESQLGGNTSTSGFRPQKDLGSGMMYCRGLRVNPGEGLTIVPGI